MIREQYRVIKETYKAKHMINQINLFQSQKESRENKEHYQELNIKTQEMLKKVKYLDQLNETHDVV